MSFINDFQANLEVLPLILRKKYGLLRDLDKSLQEIQRQNEQRCNQEIEAFKWSNIKDSSQVGFSEEALDEQKHAIMIADEKISLALQAYDLVDDHVQQLDQYLKKFGEDIHLVVERDNVATTGSPATSASALKTSTETATEDPSSMKQDIPVDPNEPRYCVCNQVSYGEMVACDHSDCKIEWFHFGCVDLKEQPKGKWYCLECAGTPKLRKGR